LEVIAIAAATWAFCANRSRLFANLTIYLRQAPQNASGSRAGQARVISLSKPCRSNRSFLLPFLLPADSGMPMTMRFNAPALRYGCSGPMKPSGLPRAF
jgi:hypothetical protein